MNVEPEYPPPWWHYPEKDAWYDFNRAHPVEAAAIDTLVLHVHFRDPSRDDQPPGGIPTTDPLLASGFQRECICLRVATLLGLVEYDWS